MAASNRFAVKYCSAPDTIGLSGAPVPGNGYSVSIASSGPDAVDITFSGPSTYHCVASVQDGIYGQSCDQS